TDERGGATAIATGVVDTSGREHVGIGADVRSADDPGKALRHTHDRVSHDDSDRNAPNSTSRSGVDGRYSVSLSERTITLAYLARLTATLSRFLLSRKEIPRGTSSIEDAVIETN